MSKEYIEKEAAIRAAQDGADEWDGGYNRNRDTYIECAIDKVPPADVKPVVRGEWKLLSHNGDKTSDYECTACYGIISDVPDDDEHDLCQFCPNCGAEMREEANDER